MRAALILPVIFVLGAVVVSSVFIVDERKQALVLQFGQVKQEVREPGLGFKIPFIQDVVYYEDRILGLPTNPIEVTPADDRRLVVDAFARWRVVDPVRADAELLLGYADRPVELVPRVEGRSGSGVSHLLSSTVKA